jgi:hypothetical protein
MNFETIFFFFFSSIALTSAIFVIYSTNTIYSAFFLILVFTSTTGLLLISEIEFISRGLPANNIFAQYNIGWYYEDGEVNLNNNPTNFRLRPLKQAASDILGLELKEIKTLQISNEVEAVNI